MPTGSEDLRVCRIASLTLVNAMIFQQVLAARDSRVQPLGRTLRNRNVAETFAETWNLILSEIDYIPIFGLARELVLELTGTPDIDHALSELATTAMRIT